MYSLTPGKESTPMEFVFDEPSTFHMNYSPLSAQSQAWLYKEASQFFEKCVVASPKRSCSVSNGKGKVSCNTDSGTYETSCQIYSCDPGFALKDNLCKACQVGFYKEDNCKTLIFSIYFSLFLFFVLTFFFVSILFYFLFQFYFPTDILS